MPRQYLLVEPHSGTSSEAFFGRCGSKSIGVHRISAVFAILKPFAERPLAMTVAAFE
ncbi:MAG: hypothetical protein WCB79_02440 [Halobacteriota archaeon]